MRMYNADIEIHVRSEPKGVANHGSAGSACAVVEHMVIRADLLRQRGPAGPENVGAMDRHLATLPYLQTVTLETFSGIEGVVLAEKLQLSRAKLRQIGRAHV